MQTPTQFFTKADTILYVTLLAADRPRAIDEAIDYFGNPPRTRAVPPPRIRDQQSAE